MGLHPGPRAHLEIPGASPGERATAARLLGELIQLPFFAHHPACRHWNNHLIRVGGHPCCLGCTCMYTGMLLGLPLFWLVARPVAGGWTLFGLGLLAYAPTLVQIYYQRYAFKMVSRTSLGIGIVFMLSAALFGHPWGWSAAPASVTMLALFVLLYEMTTRLRARHLDVPCERCTEGSFPFGAWRQPRIHEYLAAAARDADPLPDSLHAFLTVLDAQLSGGGGGAGTPAVEFVSLPHGHAGDQRSGAGAGSPERRR